jgi:fibro-slime domain-containing protein
VLEAVIRDFSEAHPDFQAGRLDDDRGIVEQWLGADGKPVYAAGPEGSSTTSGPESFDQWFRDVSGINLSRPMMLPLSASRADVRLFVFDGLPFFPIDDELLGNEGFPRNYHFTLEAVADFDYLGGETFLFEGDDDVWVFVNGYLIIDLGGVHSRRSASVSLDEIADAAGIQLGNRYSLHLFFAERQTFGSNFFVETSIANLARCPDL